MFMDSESGVSVLNELRRYIHANSVDRHTVRKFIDTLFSKTSLKNDANLTSTSAGDVVSDVQKAYCEVALPIANLVQQLDMPVSNLKKVSCK